MDDETTIEIEFAGDAPVETTERKAVKSSFSKVLFPQDRARIYICLAALVASDGVISEALKELAAEYKALDDDRVVNLLNEIGKALADEEKTLVQRSSRLKEVLIAKSVTAEEALLLAKAGSPSGSACLRAAAEIALLSEK
ncbi:hypothetical protein [Roseibium sp. RKSG952]|uniref:hypothetical protein n=1 Tax=Roseibium sp. RKSG952 TaxID=2529384 RepID=UPI0012BB49A9|nr:hypothetical protein [Roseibium sp. RKSG952]MTH94931.1 hypothetical protein [Roseibium sp. RKSG952]